ncbi:hypothetical protein [Microbacterium lacticum]
MSTTAAPSAGIHGGMPLTRSGSMTRRTPAAHRRRTGSLTRGAGATRQVRRDEVEHAGARGELGDDGHGDDEEQDRPHPVGDREASATGSTPNATAAPPARSSATPTRASFTASIMDPSPAPSIATFTTTSAAPSAAPVPRR